jgi:hypothetical protein
MCNISGFKKVATYCAATGGGTEIISEKGRFLDELIADWSGAVMVHV